MLRKTITALIEERKQIMTYSYNSSSNAAILSSAPERNTSFSHAMLSTVCKDLHYQFHGCFTTIQFTKAGIGIKASIQAKTSENQNILMVLLILFKS